MDGSKKTNLIYLKSQTAQKQQFFWAVFIYGLDYRKGSDFQVFNIVPDVTTVGVCSLPFITFQFIQIFLC